MATPDVRRASTPLGLVERHGRVLPGKGIENPRLDAEVLLAHVLGTERIGLYLHFDKPLESGGGGPLSRTRAPPRARGARRVSRRAQGILVAALRGGPGVLVPRPDTERLVEGALDEMGDAGRFAELGMGSGAVSVALLSERPGWIGGGRGLRSRGAAAPGRKRKILRADRLELRQGDLFGPWRGNLSISSSPIPPTFLAATSRGWPRSRRHEPRVALDGGPDGFDSSGASRRDAKDFLAKGAASVGIRGGTGPGRGAVPGRGGGVRGTRNPVGLCGAGPRAAGAPRREETSERGGVDSDCD